MLQVTPRNWPAEAIHDTVHAVVQGGAFRRSLQSSVAERLLAWAGDWLGSLFGFLDGTTSARTIALWFTGLMVLLVGGRLLAAAQARDPEGFAARTGRATSAENPWRAADRLAAEGRFEEAVHALYRAVLVSLARTERLRLDPSKTSGDYARELRARTSASLPAYRAFVRRFDLEVDGHGRCDAESVRALRALANPFAPGARAA